MIVNTFNQSSHTYIFIGRTTGIYTQEKPPVSLYPVCPESIRLPSARHIMSSNVTTCPDGVPEPSTLAIPSSITFAVVASNDTSNPALMACCGPNPVNLAQGCFAWCEAPSALDSADDFSTCLSMNENDGSRWRHGGLGWHEKNGAATTSPAIGLFVLGIWALSAAALSWSG